MQRLTNYIAPSINMNMHVIAFRKSRHLSSVINIMWIVSKFWCLRDIAIIGGFKIFKVIQI